MYTLRGNKSRIPKVYHFLTVAIYSPASIAAIWFMNLLIYTWTLVVILAEPITDHIADELCIKAEDYS